MNYRLKGLEPLLRFAQWVARGTEVPAGRRREPQVRGSSRGRRPTSVGPNRVVIPRARSFLHEDAYFAAEFFLHPTFYDRQCSCSFWKHSLAACRSSRDESKRGGQSFARGGGGIVVTRPHEGGDMAGAIVRCREPGGPRAAASAAARRRGRGGPSGTTTAVMMAVVVRGGAGRSERRPRSRTPIPGSGGPYTREMSLPRRHSNFSAGASY